jgi:hypothetical protein
MEFQKMLNDGCDGYFMMLGEPTVAVIEDVRPSGSGEPAVAMKENVRLNVSGESLRLMPQRNMQTNIR